MDNSKSLCSQFRVQRLRSGPPGPLASARPGSGLAAATGRSRRPGGAARARAGHPMAGGIPASLIGMMPASESVIGKMPAATRDCHGVPVESRARQA